MGKFSPEIIYALRALGSHRAVLSARKTLRPRGQKKPRITQPRTYSQSIFRIAHLAHVPARVCELRPPEAEDPVDGLGAVDDLEAAVGGEERVAVGEEAEVTLPHEGYLKHKRE